REPRFDISENLEDMTLTRLCGGIGRIIGPLRFAYRLTGRCPVLFLDGEINVCVWVRFPPLALEHPAGLSSATCITSARNHICEFAVRILRIFLQVADALQTLLVPKLHATEVQDAVLHG